VVYLSSEITPEGNYLRIKFPPEKVQILTQSDEALMKKYSMGNNATLSLIRHGRLVKQTTGTAAVSDLLQVEKQS
jgi:hypothetical protein